MRENSDVRMMIRSSFFKEMRSTWARSRIDRIRMFKSPWRASGFN